MPIAVTTAGPTSVSLTALTPKVIVPANAMRVGLILCNSTLTNIFIGIGPIDPTDKVYTWRLDAGEDWAAPSYVAFQEVRAYSTVLVNLLGGLSYTEFFVP
jgi:hypothetical protein